MAGGGGRVVPGQPLHDPELIEGAGDGVPVADVSEESQCLLEASGGGRVVTGPPLHTTQAGQGTALALPVADLPVQPEGLLEAGGGGREATGLQLGVAQVSRAACWPSLSLRSWDRSNACCAVDAAAG